MDPQLLLPLGAGLVVEQVQLRDEILHLTVRREAAGAVCPRCGTMFMGQLWIDDLKKVVEQLGFDYQMDNGRTLQDYCPRCKRIMRGLAYANLPQKREPVFQGSRIAETSEDPV